MFFLSKRVRIHTHAHVHPHMPIKTQWYISGFALITWHILPNSFRRREKEREDVPFFTLSIRSRWRGRRNESVTFTIHVSAISSLQSLLETCPLASFFFFLSSASFPSEQNISRVAVKAGFRQITKKIKIDGGCPNQYTQSWRAYYWLRLISSD